MCDGILCLHQDAGLRVVCTCMSSIFYILSGGAVQKCYPARGASSDHAEEPRFLMQAEDAIAHQTFD
jgi:hypothetical protein